MNNLYFVLFILINLIISPSVFSQDEKNQFTLALEHDIRTEDPKNQDIVPNGPNAQIMNPSIADFIVNERVGNSRKSDVQTAINSNGFSAIVWNDYREGNSNIYVQILDSLGQLIGGNLQINSTDDVRTYYQPGIAVNNKNNFLIIWTDIRSYTKIFGQFIDENGVLIGENFEISDQDIRTAKYYPAIGSNGDEFIVTWSDTRGGSFYDIYGQRLNTEGIKINNNFIVNADSQNYSKYYSQPTIDHEGNIFVAWRGLEDSKYSIYSKVLDNFNIPLSSEIKLTDDAIIDYSEGFPDVAIIDSGFVTVWYRYINNDYNIIGQYTDHFGNKIGDNFIVNDVESSSQLYPSVSSDSSGNFLINWYDYRNGFSQIYGQVFEDNKPIGANFKVSEDGKIGSKSNISCSVNDQGKFITAWLDLEELTEYKIFVRLHKGSNPSISSLRIDDDLFSSSQEYPSMEVFDDGSFIIAWSDSRNRSSRTFYQLFDSEGKSIGENIPVAENGSHLNPGIIKLTDGNFIIYWREYARNIYNQYEIVAQKFFKSGEKIGEKLILSNDQINGNVYSADAASNNNGEFVITWDKRVGNLSRIYARKFDSLGNSLNDFILVTLDTTFNSYRPKIGIDSNGNFAISYYDYKEGNYNIKLKRYNTNTEQIGEELTVNDDMIRVNQYVPDLSVNSNGNCIVAWFDYRNNIGIYYQSYINIGSENLFSKIDSNMAVADYQFNYCIPNVSMSENNVSVVSWAEPNGNYNDIKLRVIGDDNKPISEIIYATEFQDRNQISQNTIIKNNKIYNVWQSNHEHGFGYDIWANMLDVNEIITEVKNMQDEFPNDFSLSQNYPNPFNPNTIITYTVPKETSGIGTNKVKLNVYDVIGRQIVTLVNKEQLPGAYSVQFEGIDLTSGIYFYTLNVNGNVHTKKMLLLK